MIEDEIALESLFQKAGGSSWTRRDKWMSKSPLKYSSGVTQSEQIVNMEIRPLTCYTLMRNDLQHLLRVGDTCRQ